MKFPALGRSVRAIGFDDAPFERRRGSTVGIAGIVCSGARLEGMVWGAVRRDGWNATETVCDLLIGRKFLPQIHLVLIDGIAFGGLNIIDLPELASRLKRPCVAVMRKRPDLQAMENAISKLPNQKRRLEILRRAGPIHERRPFIFQVAGGDPDMVAGALCRLTDRGNVPEALRLAHLIGAAVKTGESGRRA